LNATRCGIPSGSKAARLHVRSRVSRMDESPSRMPMRVPMPTQMRRSIRRIARWQRLLRASTECRAARTKDVLFEGLSFPPWKSGAEAVQFRDMLYKTFRDILYTRPAGVAGGGTIVERVRIGSKSQIRVRR